MRRWIPLATLAFVLGLAVVPFLILLHGIKATQPGNFETSMFGERSIAYLLETRT